MYKTSLNSDMVMLETLVELTLKDLMTEIYLFMIYS